MIPRQVSSSTHDDKSSAILLQSRNCTSVHSTVNYMYLVLNPDWVWTELRIRGSRWLRHWRQCGLILENPCMFWYPRYYTVGRGTAVLVKM